MEEEGNGCGEGGGGGDDCKLGTLASSSNCFIISEIFSRWGVFPVVGKERFGPIEEGRLQGRKVFPVLGQRLLAVF